MTPWRSLRPEPSGEGHCASHNTNSKGASIVSCPGLQENQNERKKNPYVLNKFFFFGVAEIMVLIFPKVRPQGQLQCMQMSSL